jgi:hypothetical protein
LDVSHYSDSALEDDVNTLLSWAISENDQQETQRRDECLSKATTLADRLTAPFRHIRVRILIEQARQSYDRLSQTDDVTTMDMATCTLLDRLARQTG